MSYEFDRSVSLMSRGRLAPSQPPRPVEFHFGRCVINAGQRVELYAIGTSVCLPGDLLPPVRERNGLGERFLKDTWGAHRWSAAHAVAWFGPPDIQELDERGKLVSATWGFMACGWGQEQLFLLECFELRSRVDLMAPARLRFAGPVLTWLHHEHLRLKMQQAIASDSRARKPCYAPQAAGGMAP